MAAVETLGIIPPGMIEYDRRNPRGETEEQIQEDKRFEELRKSVRKHGVLVPVIVIPSGKKKVPYRLVDGERRVRAAVCENIEGIPVHVVTGEDVDGRILAYNIHMLGKPWTKANELTSIREIIRELEEQNSELSESEIAARLRDVTGHKGHELRDLQILLRYNDTTIEKVQSGNLRVSYLVHIDASFLAPFRREFPRVYGGYEDGRLREILVRKAEDGRLGNTRYLMDHVLTLFKDENKNKLRAALKCFLDNPDEDVKGIVTKMKREPEKRKAKKKIAKKAAEKAKKRRTKAAGTTEDPRSEPFESRSMKITKRHEKRIADIEPLFAAVAGGFSDQEREYIKEALYCLENHCFKAAILMIWAAGISRILQYVDKNIADFHARSDEMRRKPKSFYKHFAGNFAKNASTIEEIKERANDRQLLCYVCYKGFISGADFTKLKNAYDTRNNCAHPTDIELEANEGIVVFQNVHKLLFDNQNLR